MRSTTLGLFLMATMATTLSAEDSQRPPEIAVYLSFQHTCKTLEELTPAVARKRGRLIFDQSEIVAVDWMKQEYRLSVPIGDRLHGADLSGAAFWLFVDGEPIYRGVHMPSHSSITCGQVHLAQRFYNDDVLEIETGSPRGSMDPPDPRRDPRLLRALRQLGVLEEPADAALPVSFAIGESLVVESAERVVLPFDETFETRLREVLGAPSRHHYDCDDEWLWDDLGVGLRARHLRGWQRVSFHLAAGELDGQPREAFRARLRVGSLPIHRKVGFDELINAGFERLGAKELVWTPPGGAVRVVAQGAEAVERLFIEPAAKSSRPVHFAVETWGDMQPSLDQADRKVAYLRRQYCTESIAELEFELAKLEGPLEIEGDVVPPQALVLETPMAAEARDLGAGGVVLIDLVIKTDGRVAAAHPIRWPDWHLRREALAAVFGWSFRPAQQQGKKVPVLARAAIDFRIR